MTLKEFRSKMQWLLSLRLLSCIPVLLCLWSADGSTSRNYNEIVKLGSSCPTLDSCAYLRTASPRQQRPQVRDRSCNCDPSCPEYDDCCIDAPLFSRGGASRNDQTCLHVEQSGGVYMRDSCPPTFTGSEAIRNLCEKVQLGDQADPLASLPVTDPTSGLTYKNFYCNLCNGDANDILMWTPKLECPLLSLLNNSRSITTPYVLQNLATDGKRWGLYLNDDSDGELFFHDCSVQPVLPSQLQRVVRPCRTGLLSDCPPWWRDEEVKRLCRSYTGARYDTDGNGYKNVHCAICNGVRNVSRLSCQPMEEVDLFRDFGTHSFAILLDVSQATGQEVGRIRQCRRGEVFDPFFKKCRGVSCLPGFVRRGRRCVMRNPMDFVKFYTSSNRKVTSSSTTSDYSGAMNATVGSEILFSTPGYVNATLLRT